MVNKYYDYKNIVIFLNEWPCDSLSNLTTHRHKIDKYDIGILKKVFEIHIQNHC